MNCKTLSVPKVLIESVQLRNEPRAFTESFDSLSSTSAIESASWKEFSTDAQVSMRAGWSGGMLYLKFSVREKEILANHTRDKAKVFEDSCVEFFAAPEGKKYYYNFEFNCLGFCLACVGPDRQNRESIGDAALESIIRIPSLDRQAIHLLEEIDGEGLEWNLLVAIPASAFVREDFRNFSGLKMTGNFYKCGDRLTQPHYLSWNPIGTPEPDFHRPEYFGDISFTG